MHPVISDPIVDRFVYDEIGKCDLHGIEVQLIKAELLTLENGVQTQGWFDGDTLAVATDKPIKQWLPVFVHETCHKDQMVEKSPFWDTKIKGYDACDLLNQWLAGVVDFTFNQFYAVTNKIIACELDCEIRTAVKIRENNLPIDLDLYIQIANAYVWSYRDLYRTRKWNATICYNPKIIEKMPKHFDNDYSIPHEAFLELGLIT